MANKTLKPRRVFMLHATFFLIIIQKFKTKHIFGNMISPVMLGVLYSTRWRDEKKNKLLFNFTRRNSCSDLISKCRKRECISQVKCSTTTVCVGCCYLIVTCLFCSLCIQETANRKVLKLCIFVCFQNDTKLHKTITILILFYYLSYQKIWQKHFLWLG